MQELNDILIESLLKADFDQRYYQYVADHKDVKATLEFNAISSITENALAAKVEKLSYDTKEKFFRFKEEVAMCTISNTIAIGQSTSIELICTIRSVEEKAGGTVHGLARKVARLRDPNFKHSPRYPRIPFGTVEELEQALQFSMVLFGDIKRAVAQSGRQTNRAS